MKLLSITNAIWLIAYLAAMVGGLFAMHRLRDWSLDELGSAEARAEWDEWRDETARQAKGSGPVERRKAKSEEPPMLVLLRDYYVTCAVGLLVFGTVLFAAMMFMVRGAFSGMYNPVELAEERPAN